MIVIPNQIPRSAGIVMCSRWLQVVIQRLLAKFTCHLSLRFGIRQSAAEDLPTTAFHSSRSSAFRKVFLSSSPVHSLMLSSQRFFCLPLLLPPFTVACMMVLARPDGRVVCPYHFSFRCQTMVRRSTFCPMAFSILLLISSFVV
ncbi:hypothetical protein PoB_005373800 [Plakobranchus ocellatus]|uniref:Transmembrane protein n=1 Tax=Plakobranchus ocellatus TaxID=259542 RepID=A0AAV4C5Q5_9GAST|nr:hypothetical protein PoB_005373800 [Plakobranchus ocellatus]